MLFGEKQRSEISWHVSLNLHLAWSRNPILWVCFFIGLHRFQPFKEVYYIKHCLELKGAVSRDFSVLVFFIKKLLLVPLEVHMDDFNFCRIFTEILDKMSAQRCMIHHGTATRWCILHHGIATRRCILHRKMLTTALIGTILQKIDQNIKLLSYNMMNMNLKVFKVCSF